VSESILKIGNFTLHLKRQGDSSCSLIYASEPGELPGVLKAVGNANAGTGGVGTKLLRQQLQALFKQAIRFKYNSYRQISQSLGWTNYCHQQKLPQLIHFGNAAFMWETPEYPPADTHVSNGSRAPRRARTPAFNHKKQVRVRSQCRQNEKQGFSRSRSATFSKAPRAPKDGSN
jgi:hypothetical protein